MKKYFLFIATLLSSLTHAKIYFDLESDPLPLVKINILVPSAKPIANDVENLSLRFLNEMYDAGTLKLERQKHQDALASFGASLSISAGPQYAEISTTFPLVDGKFPAELKALIEDSWKNPRIQKDTFERAKKQLLAQHNATLDRDNALLSIGVQKFIAKRVFALHPHSTETFNKIKLADVVNIQKNHYDSSADVWIGVIAPESLKEDIQAFAQKLFPEAAPLSNGMIKAQLATGHNPILKFETKPTFLLIDKKDLAQVHYGFVRLFNKKTTDKTELVDNFNYRILAGAGIESIYGKNIRGDRGLSYVVGGLMDAYYNYPIVSLYANPQRNKQTEAFEVLEKMYNETFNQGKILAPYNNDTWSSWILSYRNSERQEGATPEGRLDRRKSIATGDLSLGLFDMPIDKWLVKKNQASDRLEEFSKNSLSLVSALGDSNELEPLVKKHFPNHEILKVNYKDILKSGWLTSK